MTTRTTDVQYFQEAEVYEAYKAVKSHRQSPLTAECLVLSLALAGQMHDLRISSFAISGWRPPGLHQHASGNPLAVPMQRS